MEQTLENLRAELDLAERMAASHQRNINSTLAQYGQGVRPSWVSADLAHDEIARDSYQAKARTARRQIAFFEKHGRSPF